MTGFGYLAKEGFKNVWNNRIMSIASVCVLISCLVLTGAAALFSLNVDKVVEMKPLYTLKTDIHSLRLFM
mgnify:CR=1 FL=1